MEYLNINYFLFKQQLIKKNTQQIIDYFTDSKLEELFNILEDFTNNELVIIADISICVELYHLILFIKQMDQNNLYLERINNLLNKIYEFMNKDSLTEEYITINYTSLAGKKRSLPSKFLFGYGLSEIEEYEIRDYDIIYLLLKDPDKLALINPIYVLSSISYLCSDYSNIVKEEKINNAIRYYLYNIIINQKEFKSNKVYKMFINVDNRFKKVDINAQIRK